MKHSAIYGLPLRICCIQGSLRTTSLWQLYVMLCLLDYDCFFQSDCTPHTQTSTDEVCHSCSSLFLFGFGIADRGLSDETVCPSTD